jgi:hypothetical protein
MFAFSHHLPTTVELLVKMHVVKLSYFLYEIQMKNFLLVKNAKHSEITKEWFQISITVDL